MQGGAPGGPQSGPHGGPHGGAHGGMHGEMQGGPQGEMQAGLQGGPQDLGARAQTVQGLQELQDHKSKLHKYKTQLFKLQTLQGSLQGGPPGGFDVAPSAASLVGMASAVAEAEA